MIKFRYLALAAFAAGVLAAGPLAGATRSVAAKHAFMRQHACPYKGVHTKYTCPGYVVDHIIPLDCGGKDVPSNMQWQTVAQAKAKDKWERSGEQCAHQTRGTK